MNPIALKFSKLFFIKDRTLLPDDIFNSILKSTETDNWYVLYDNQKFHNLLRSICIKYSVFFGYVFCSHIPETKYYIDRERSLILLKAITENIKRKEEKDLEKERDKLSKSLLDLEDEIYQRIESNPKLPTTSRTSKQ